MGTRLDFGWLNLEKDTNRELGSTYLTAQMKRL